MEMLNVNELKKEEPDLECENDNINLPFTSSSAICIKRKDTFFKHEESADIFESEITAASDTELFQNVSPIILIII